MIKRALAATLCLILVFALLPKTALAASNTLCFFEGRLYTDDTHITHYTGGGWSGNGSTLTLTNFNFTTSAATALQLPGGTTLVLNGRNSVTSSYNGADTDTCGIRCEGVLTIKGTGTLTATGGTLLSTGTAGSYGVYSKDGITVSGSSITGTGGEVKNTGQSCGVYVKSGKISVENGGTIKGTGGDALDQSSSYGVQAEEAVSSIHAENGSIIGTGGNSETHSSYGVYSAGTIYAGSGGSITGTGGTAKGAVSYGVFANNDVITVDGGNITGISSQAHQPVDSLGIVANRVNVNSGRLVGDSFVGGSAIWLTDASTITLPSNNLTAYYWRTSKSDPYTRYELPPQVEYVWDTAQTYVDIRTSLPPGEIADVPQTGDSATPVLWLSLILLTGAGLIVRRKRQNG